MKKKIVITEFHMQQNKSSSLKAQRVYVHGICNIIDCNIIIKSSPVLRKQT